ncbi:MAG: kinase/pyrophosphorylase [Xanthomonadales bacterium]|nr:kinase/pyrophosphorylase [Xanthomonadales bacterium]
MSRTVFFVSDGTGITAETLGHALLTQFAGLEFQQFRLPFIDTEEKAREAVAQINHQAVEDGNCPLVFTTMINTVLAEIINGGQCKVFDLFSEFIQPLEKQLGVKAQPSVGAAHSNSDTESYEARMEATNYALTHDDGMSINFANADLILVGVSRSGKTPTCLYLALHFGIKAANYPLTDDDMDASQLPKFLLQNKNKLVGLTIDPERLSQIRMTRKPDSRYSSLRQCRYEVESAESLLRLAGVPIMRTTNSSVEEIASRIVSEKNIQKPHF